MISPRGALGMRTIAAASTTIPVNVAVEELRVAPPTVKGVADPEDVAEGVRGREGHRRGADYRGVEQDDGEHRTGAVADVVCKPARPLPWHLVNARRCFVCGESARRTTAMIRDAAKTVMSEPSTVSVRS